MIKSVLLIFGLAAFFYIISVSSQLSPVSSDKPDCTTIKCNATVDRPVCASNRCCNKTFGNTCLVQLENCKLDKDKAFVVIHNGKCTKKDERLCPQADCCPKDYKPVCAYNGTCYQKFNNTCLLDSRNIKDGFKQVHEGECTDREQPLCCPIDCTKEEYYPVCACNSKKKCRTFDNKCLVELKNCEDNDDYVAISEGPCEKL